MMGLFWLHQHHRRSAQRQNYPYRAQPWVNNQSLQNSLRKTAWDKRGTNERKGWYQHFLGTATSNQEADSTFKYPKWHEMKMMWERLCLCSLMGHQDLLIWWCRLTCGRYSSQSYTGAAHTYLIVNVWCNNGDDANLCLCWIFEKHIDTKLIWKKKKKKLSAQQQSWAFND